MSFQWDRDKAQANLDNHKIDFSDAAGVFEDQWALTIKEDYVDDEQRFVTLAYGLSWTCAGRGLYLSRRRYSLDTGAPRHEIRTENL